MPRANRYGLTAAGFAAFVLVAFSSLALPRTIFEIGRSFSWSAVAKGNLFSSYGVGFIVGALVSGSLAGSVTRKPLVIAALLLSLCGHFLFGYVGSLSLDYRYAVLLGLNGIIGCGIGMLEGVLNALLVDLHPRRASLFLNVGHGFYSLGAAVGPVIAGFVMKLGWQWVFYFNTLLSAALIGAFGLMVWPPGKRQERLQFGEALRLVPRWGFLVAAVSIVLVVGAELGLTSWIVEFVRTSRGFQISDVGAGLFLSYFSLAMLGGRFAYGFFAERVSSVGALFISALGGGVAIALFLLVGSLLGSIVFIVLYGLFISGMIATLITYACEKFPSHVGTISGLMTAALGIGVAVFPSVIGRIATTGGLGLGLWVCAVNLFVVGIIMLVVMRRRTAAKAHS
jgi:fucose permease